LWCELPDLGRHYALRALPIETCSAVGARLGSTMGRRAHPVADAHARALLTRLRPDLTTPEAREAALVRLWENVGRLFAEYSVIHRLLPRGRVTLSDPALLDAVCADDRPLILCFAHLGNWEVLLQQMATHCRLRGRLPLVAVVMQSENPVHAFIAARLRRSLPLKVVPTGPQVWRTVAERLRRPRGTVWLAADETRDGRVLAPHFGRRLRIDGNLGKIVRLAAATGARVLPIYSERLRGARFVSRVLPPLEMPRGRLDDDAIRAQVARIDGIFEPIVRRLAEQWYMAVEFGEDAQDVMR
jgi:KDO2-lipid IV(A) lauroyltransferase